MEKLDNRFLEAYTWQKYQLQVLRTMLIKMKPSHYTTSFYNSACRLTVHTSLQLGLGTVFSSQLTSVYTEEIIHVA